MKFSARNGTALEGVLTYSESEYGFSFTAQSPEGLAERLGSDGVTSALIETLQLEIDIESREFLFAWGYFPGIRSNVEDLDVPKFLPGRVSLSAECRFEPGVSFDISEEVWRTGYDPSSGWVAVRLRDPADAVFVQIADGIVLGVSDGDLVSVWLRPAFSE
ncbi:hypothetical protein ACFRAR_01810 [Kitasatospora sp. NPDC056651]|uniref:hypothetical protein n=1 Tax=Kitasatospora sp. NPDC056651 TaxID=3345892 RepID=UPI0036C78543